MFIREYSESDLDALRSIHAAQGFDYALPDLRNPLFVTKLVLAAGDAEEKVENGQQEAGGSKILGAAFLRLTAEAYLFPNPRPGTPPERWQCLLALHAA